MKFYPIIQVRTASSRLPCKVLKTLSPYDRVTILGHTILRLHKIGHVIQKPIVAVPTDENKILLDFLDANDIHYVEGDHYHVLKRYILASQFAKDKDYVIRLTGDNPFIDYKMLEKNTHYVRQVEPDLSYPSYLPLGMGFEIIQVKILRNLIRLPLSGRHCEHVTSYLKEYHEQFNIQPLFLKISSYPNYPIRLTIDETEDLELARKVYQYFRSINKPYFCAQDIYALYRKDDTFFNDNIHIYQNSMYTTERTLV